MIAKALSSLSEHTQIHMDNIYNCNNFFLVVKHSQIHMDYIYNCKSIIAVVRTYSNTHGQHFQLQKHYHRWPNTLKYTWTTFLSAKALSSLSKHTQIHMDNIYELQKHYHRCLNTLKYTWTILIIPKALSSLSKYIQIHMDNIWIAKALSSLAKHTQIQHGQHL